jgi:hypothetical protein
MPKRALVYPLLLAALVEDVAAQPVVAQGVAQADILAMVVLVLEPMAPVVLALLAVALLVAEAKPFTYTVLLVLQGAAGLVFWAKVQQAQADQAEFVTQNPEAAVADQAEHPAGIVLAAFTAVAVLDNRL